MRRSLILTVAAAVALVLLAMLVPTSVLLRGYELEDRLATAALEAQATESAVARAGGDRAQVTAYVDDINAASSTSTTVLYPDGRAIGPRPGEDALVAQTRESGQARVDDVPGGVELLIPVTLRGSSAAPQNTTVLRIFVPEPSWWTSRAMRANLILVGLGVLLLVGALLVADRLGRSFVQPIRALAGYTSRLGADPPPEPLAPAGPPEVRELTSTVQSLVARIEALVERDRRTVSDLSHRLRTPLTALRLRIDALPEGPERAQLAADCDDLQRLVDHLVDRARRTEREGLVAEADATTVVAERCAFWGALAEDQGRTFAVTLPDEPVPVRSSPTDLTALVDVLLDNVFTHTPEGAGLSVTLEPRPAGGAVLTVDDAGPGFPGDVDVVRRGISGADSTGLGLAIADATATESGGDLVVGRSPADGGRVVVVLGGLGG